MLEYIKSNKITKIDNQIKETNDNGDEYSETTGYTDRSYDWDSLNYDDISNNVIPQEGTFSNIIIPKYCDKININKKLNKFENRIECKHEKIDSINIGQILKTSGNNVQDSNDTENFNYEIIMEKDANILPCIKNNKLNFKNINQPKNDVRVKFISKDIVVDAIIEGEIDLVKKLSNEIEITKEVNIDGITALHHAAFSADAEMVQFLIKLGCNVNALDVDAWTPLHCAASCDHYEISKLLVCHGASIFARTVTDNQTTKQKCEIKSEFSTCFDFLTKCEKSIRSAEKSEYYVAFNFKSENNYELSVNASDRIVINTNLTHQDDQYWIHVTLIKTNNSGFIPLSHVSIIQILIKMPKEKYFNEREKSLIDIIVNEDHI
ncbi:hypothetical protein A3Q56_05211 [Intoshia linei]|uniref:SH3 domain-containing protein n=1 Tax=Intoshia linei TaxID=1819745 RepID=A0A177B0A5_9BILA|nr:hypothetical protein A3Q56_05211 [Intoshia linei]